jgi:hypothetical protein
MALIRPFAIVRTLPFRTCGQWLQDENALR